MVVDWRGSCQVLSLNFWGTRVTWCHLVSQMICYCSGWFQGMVALFSNIPTFIYFSSSPPRQYSCHNMSINNHACTTHTTAQDSKPMSDGSYDIWQVRAIMENILNVGLVVLNQLQIFQHHPANLYLRLWVVANRFFYRLNQSLTCWRWYCSTISCFIKSCFKRYVVRAAKQSYVVTKSSQIIITTTTTTTTIITRSTQRAQTSLAEADHYSHIAHCKNVEPWLWKTTPPPKKKKKKKKRFWIITCTTIWVCYHYYGGFLLIYSSYNTQITTKI